MNILQLFINFWKQFKVPYLFEVSNEIFVSDSGLYLTLCTINNLIFKISEMDYPRRQHYRWQGVQDEPSCYWPTCAYHGHGQQSTRLWVRILFQVLLMCKPVLDLNFALVSKDLFRSHMRLALSLEYQQRQHDHGVTNSCKTEVKILPLLFKLRTWSDYFQAGNVGCICMRF